MTVRQVMYADWAMECCGTPFSVGDEVVWEASPGAADDPEDAGVLHVATHGAGGPDTRRVAGRVRSIRVVTDGFTVLPGTGEYRRAPGERSLRAVRTCPKWFRRSPAEGGRRRYETGVLVEVETSAEASVATPMETSGG
ncbi:DUF6578 domain-containing protein [Streptomyces sp. NPDC051320]|uniref:DUF6578 domain-containing protein n=1 Tax=Streptomyces sp. NPDC051320 TaxID=3154644 RepID=UPI00342E3356